MTSISGIIYSTATFMGKVGLCMLAPNKSIYLGRDYFNQAETSKMFLIGVCAANVAAASGLGKLVSYFSSQENEAPPTEENIQTDQHSNNSMCRPEDEPIYPTTHLHHHDNYFME